jgi:hypothetical protein
MSIRVTGGRRRGSGLTAQGTAETGVVIYPMTYEQEALWVDDFLDDGPSRYLESWVYRLSGPVDLDAVEWSIARVVDRHEVLRSRMTIDKRKFVQIVQREADTRLIRRVCPESDLDQVLREIVREPLDLDVAPLRATALLLGPDEVVLVVQFHHIVVDDWALAVMDEEFGEFYSARVLGRAPDLPPLPIQFGNYALAQRSQGVDPGVLSYWQDQIGRVPDHGRDGPGLASSEGGQVTFRLGDETGTLVRRVARSARITPFTLFAATFAAWLCAAEEGRQEMLLATPVSRRGDASLDGLIGCVVNLLPLYLAASPSRPFAELLAGAKRAVLGALAHKDMPYCELAARAGTRHKNKIKPLFRAVLVVDDAPRVPLAMPGVSAERIYVYSGMVKVELCLTLVIDGSGYRGFLDYAKESYRPEQAERIADGFQRLLAVALPDPQRSLAEIYQVVSP